MLSTKDGVRPIRLRYPAAVLLSLSILLPGAAEAKPYTRADYHHAARAVYDGKAPATRKERRHLRAVIHNQRAPRKSRPIIRLHQRRYRARHLYRLEVAALTPYGQWAIPEYIVACESGGSWSAFNSSGAAGPYQVMPEWGRPWPVDSRADRIAHHRIAFRLWAGGAGASNWVCA